MARAPAVVVIATVTTTGRDVILGPFRIVWRLFAFATTAWVLTGGAFAVGEWIGYSLTP